MILSDIESRKLIKGLIEGANELEDKAHIEGGDFVYSYIEDAANLYHKAGIISMELEDDLGENNYELAEECFILSGDLYLTADNKLLAFKSYTQAQLASEMRGRRHPDDPERAEVRIETMKENGDAAIRNADSLEESFPSWSYDERLRALGSHQEAGDNSLRLAKFIENDSFDKSTPSEASEQYRIASECFYRASDSADKLAREDQKIYYENLSEILEESAEEISPGKKLKEEIKSLGMNLREDDQSSN